MPRAATLESDVPITERVKRLVGAGMRGRDIQLPQEGKRDPRLGAEKPDVLGAFKEAGRGFKAVRELAGKSRK
jgi:hypothetical protein